MIVSPSKAGFVLRIVEIMLYSYILMVSLIMSVLFSALYLIVYFYTLFVVIWLYWERGGKNDRGHR